MAMQELRSPAMARRSWLMEKHSWVLLELHKLLVPKNPCS
jgi:hypothetical protein